MYLLLVKVYNFIFYIVAPDTIPIILYSIHFFKMSRECVEKRLLKWFYHFALRVILQHCGFLCIKIKNGSIVIVGIWLWSCYQILKKIIKRILTVSHRSILPLRALLQNWKKKLEINANLFVNICILNRFLYKNVK